MRLGSPRPALMGANQEWALDFAHDAIAAGRNIRALSVVDAFTRERLALEVDTGFASQACDAGAGPDHRPARGARRRLPATTGPELTWALE